MVVRSMVTLGRRSSPRGTAAGLDCPLPGPCGPLEARFPYKKPKLHHFAALCATSRLRSYVNTPEGRLRRPRHTQPASILRPPFPTLF